MRLAHEFGQHLVSLSSRFWHYTQPSADYCLQVSNDIGQDVIIPQLLVLEACHTLGICLAPDGNNNDKMCYLLEVAKTGKPQWQWLSYTFSCKFCVAPSHSQQTWIPTTCKNFYSTAMQWDYASKSIHQSAIGWLCPHISMCHCAWTMVMGRSEHFPSLHGRIHTAPSHLTEDGEQPTNMTCSLLQASCEALHLESSLSASV